MNRKNATTVSKDQWQLTKVVSYSSFFKNYFFIQEGTKGNSILVTDWSGGTDIIIILMEDHARSGQELKPV